MISVRPCGSNTETSLQRSDKPWALTPGCPQRRRSPDNCLHRRFTPRERVLVPRSLHPPPSIPTAMPPRRSSRLRSAPFDGRSRAGQVSTPENPCRALLVRGYASVLVAVRALGFFFTSLVAADIFVVVVASVFFPCPLLRCEWSAGCLSGGRCFEPHSWQYLPPLSPLHTGDCVSCTGVGDRKSVV